MRKNKRNFFILLYGTLLSGSLVSCNKYNNINLNKRSESLSFSDESNLDSGGLSFSDEFNIDQEDFIEKIELEIGEATLLCEIDSNNKKATIVGVVDKDKIGWTLEIPEYINDDNNKFEIVKIASEAFSGCSNLETITIPKTIINICVGAFGECENLKEIKIYKDLYLERGTFRNSNQVEIIAFENKNIKKFIKNDSDLTPYTGEIQNGPNRNILVKIVDVKKTQILKKEIDIGEATVSCELDLGDKTATLIKVVDPTQDLKDLVIPEYIDNEYKVIRIVEGAFASCSKLKSVTIPGTVKTVERFSFSQCDSLENITLSRGVEFVESLAFWGCKRLKNLNIYSDNLIISKKSFFECNTTFGTLVSGGDFLNKDGGIVSGNITDDKSNIYFLNKKPNRLCADDILIYWLDHENKTAKVVDVVNKETLERLVIPGYVENESKYKVTDIYEYTFQNCKNLKSVEVGENVKDINKFAFSDCPKLNKVILGSNVEKIKEGAFENSENLEEIEIYGDLKIEKNVFKNSKKFQMSTYSSKKIDIFESDEYTLYDEKIQNGPSRDIYIKIN